MNVLIVDHRERFSRASVIRDALLAAGHSVVWCAHVDGVTPGHERIRNWSSVRSRAMALAASRDSVLLHVGDDQSMRVEFLRECCANIPVLCYYGGSADDDVMALCRTNGSHAIYPEPIDDVPAESAIEQIGRWVGQIEAARGDRDAIRQACQKVEGFQQECEDKLSFLSSVLRGGDAAHINALGAQLGLTGDFSLENLRDLRNVLFPEW